MKNQSRLSLIASTAKRLQRNREKAIQHLSRANEVNPLRATLSTVSQSEGFAFNGVTVSF